MCCLSSRPSCDLAISYMLIFMVLNATFNNISVISWQSVLLVEETRVSGENSRPVASHRQSLSHYVVLSTPHNVSGDRHCLWLVINPMSIWSRTRCTPHIIYDHDLWSQGQITDLIWSDFCHFQQYFSYIMATSFSGGRSQRTRREPPTMRKQLANFITCAASRVHPFL